MTFHLFLKNLAPVGMMESMKSSVGKILADSLGYYFFDRYMTCLFNIKRLHNNLMCSQVRQSHYLVTLVHFVSRFHLYCQVVGLWVLKLKLTFAVQAAMVAVSVTSSHCCCCLWRVHSALHKTDVHSKWQWLCWLWRAVMCWYNQQQVVLQKYLMTRRVTGMLRCEWISTLIICDLGM